MTNFPNLFGALAKPFDPLDIKARSLQGRQLHYITARTCMNRLDTVLGPENWWDAYTASENSVLCCLTIRLPDGSTLTKCDAGGYAGMSDSGDDDKSGYSDSFKRAAVKFGVGRHLYRDGIPCYETSAPPEAAPAPAPAPAPVALKVHTNGDGNGHAKVKGAWGSPGNQPAAATATKPADPMPSAPARSAHAGPPRTGRALFAWTKEQEQVHEVVLLKYLSGWAKLQEFPMRMVDWDAGQVALAYAEAQRKLNASLPPDPDDRAITYDDGADDGRYDDR